MASKTSIANRALVKLGQVTTADVESENSKAAKTINSMYDTVRDAVLREHVWNFAVRRAQVAKNTNTPAYEWDHEYPYPEGCLRILEIKDKDPGQYDIENNKILTDDDGPLFIKYIKQITDEGEFDSLFIEAFASRLAYESAEALTQSNTKKEAALVDYQRALSEARSVDAVENVGQALDESGWVSVRYSGRTSISGYDPIRGS